MNSNKKIARVAGLLYLIVIICGVFVEFFVRSKLIVPNNAAATANNIINSELLFRIGFVSDLIMLTAYFFLPMALYLLLKPVNKNYALLMVSCVLVAVSILCINMLNHIAPLLILNGTDFLNVFEKDQMHGIVMFFLYTHKHGYLIAQIFFGLWLFPLGYLVFKSGFFPRILGIFLMIGSCAYLIDFFIFFLFPNDVSIISPIITLPADLAEISFCLWLLIVGIKDKQIHSIGSDLGVS